MNDEQRHFLALVGQAPARLTAEQTACLLNCQPYDIPLLVAARLLRPLGDSPANTVKYFSLEEIRQLMRDRAWLSRMTNTLQHYWHRKNHRGQSQ